MIYTHVLNRGVRGPADVQARGSPQLVEVPGAGYPDQHTQWLSIWQKDVSPVIPGHEKRVVAIELQKHLAAISLGAIAVIASLFTDLAKTDRALSLLKLSVAAFVTAVLASTFSCVVLLSHLENYTEIMGTRLHRAHQFSMFLLVAAFLLGVLSFAAVVFLYLG